MNCLEYRRRLLTDPRCSDAAVRQHAAGCATCSAWTEGRVRQEESLALALDVPVPANLADRILLDVQLRARRPRQWALAAMLMLAVCAAVGGWWLRLNAAPENWNAVVLAHVLAEPHTLTRDDAVPVARLQAALAEYALSADAPLGRIQYLDHCELPGGRGLHIVLRSPDAGQVSLNVPPPRHLVTAPSARLARGTVRPHDRRGHCQHRHRHNATRRWRTRRSLAAKHAENAALLNRHVSLGQCPSSGTPVASCIPFSCQCRRFVRGASDAPSARAPARLRSPDERASRIRHGCPGLLTPPWAGPDGMQMVRPDERPVQSVCDP